jgi:geranylgeranyl transferase type-2 subunit beta
MGKSFLESLDLRLAAGLAPLARTLSAPALGFVLAHQTPEGGIRGRLGGADLYYTDFGLRILVLVGSDPEPLRRIGRYLEGFQEPPGDLITAFDLLNAARLLGSRGNEVSFEGRALEGALLRQRLPGGGFASPGDSVPSAYQTFIASLCHEILGREMPDAGAAVRDVARLAAPDGGYVDRPGGSTAQTNPTAAALAFLSAQGALDPEEAESAVEFLSRMQAGDGGLRAQPSAPGGDLLSTFTALAALAGVGALELLDLAAAGRFAMSLRTPEGGFRSCVADPEADVEYTYYGLGTLALLRAHLDESSLGEGGK